MEPSTQDKAAEAQTTMKESVVSVILETGIGSLGDTEVECVWGFWGMAREHARRRPDHHDRSVNVTSVQLRLGLLGSRRAGRGPIGPVLREAGLVFFRPGRVAGGLRYNILEQFLYVRSQFMFRVQLEKNL